MPEPSDNTDGTLFVDGHTLEMLAWELAEFVRNSVRAAASQTPSSRVFQATQHLRAYAALQPPGQMIHAYKLVDAVVDHLQNRDREGFTERHVARAARLGTQLFLEFSSPDGFAQARASQRTSEFLAAIRLVEKERRTVRVRQRKPRPI